MSTNLLRPARAETGRAISPARANPLPTMKPTEIGNLIERQTWLEPVENTLQTVAEATLKPAGQGVRDFLHGTWLGHPLHPAISDLPIGAWSTAALFDVIDSFTGEETYAEAADLAVKVGVVTAVGVATAGLCDWHKIGEGPARRAGALHALFNSGALLCYIASWVQRRGGHRPAGVATGLAGLALVLAGAWLGGHMSYAERIGVDHAQRGGPEEWTPVLAHADLPESLPRKVSAHGIDILLVKRNGRVFAIGEKCAHLRGPLSEGKLEGDTVVCPWHGSRFSLETGEVVDGPAVYGQSCFEARTVGEQIEVRVRRAES